MTRDPSAAIIERIAEREGVDPAELRPVLYDVVDPTSLDNLFSNQNDEGDSSHGSVTFQYCGYQIAMTADGEVSVFEGDDGDP